MYLQDFELPEEFKSLPGKNALQKIYTIYRAYDNIDIAVGVYKIITDENENVKDVVYVYANKGIGEITHNDHKWMIGRSYLDTVKGATSKWFDIGYEAGCLGKVLKDTVYAPGLQRFLHFTAQQAFAPGYAIFMYDRVSDVPQVEESIRKAWKTDDLVITISKILRANGSMDIIVEKAMDEVGRAMYPDQLYILEVLGNDTSVFYEWRSDKMKTNNKLAGQKVNKLTDGWDRFFKNSSCVQMTDIEELKEVNSFCYELLKERDVRTFLAAPFYYRGKVQGYLVAENAEENSEIKTVDLLETASFFLGAELRAGRLMRELEYQSRHDLLTEIGNRNAMELKIKEIKKLHGSIGIIYADINGLKEINDKYGHNAGDAKIIATANTLRQVFEDQKVYRAGGDEFVVFEENATKEEVREHLDKVKELAKKQQLAISTGMAFCNDQSFVEDKMREADQAMYEEKKAYYMTHDKYNRRHGR